MFKIGSAAESTKLRRLEVLAVWASARQIRFDRTSSFLHGSGRSLRHPAFRLPFYNVAATANFVDKSAATHKRPLAKLARQIARQTPSQNVRALTSPCTSMHILAHPSSYAPLCISNLCQPARHAWRIQHMAGGTSSQPCAFTQRASAPRTMPPCMTAIPHACGTISDFHQHKNTDPGQLARRPAH